LLRSVFVLLNAERPIKEQRSKAIYKDEYTNDLTRFSPQVKFHKRFIRSWLRLPLDKRQAVIKTIELLCQHPDHPSLCVHAVKRAKDLRECYVSRTHRLIYRTQDAVIHIINVGKHDCIDHVHHGSPDL
jgi:mRNA-degrading endonuclease YafQ of YafQ-DinJ toxin-antitoxin module